MQQRPIKILVEALNKIGANIKYLKNDGFPPIKINKSKLWGGKINLDANVSSQYVSALIMIAPSLPKGLEINFTGEIVSKPYINMTINMLKYFGAEVSWENNTITIKNGKYQPKTFIIEADWSAASYWYEMVALSKEADIFLYGLKKESLQGDAIVKNIYKNFGVKTTFINGGIRLQKSPTSNLKLPISNLNIDFTTCPDIAQTVAVTCAALNVSVRLTGLKTLRIKETNRILALQNELTKLGYDVEIENDDLIINQHLREKGKLLNRSNNPIKTYNDHRMAMAFAPLSLRYNIIIEDKDVVKKSYQNYWKDLEKVGFNLMDNDDAFLK